MQGKTSRPSVRGCALMAVALAAVLPATADARRQRVYTANSTCYAAIADPERGRGRMADGTFVRDRSIAMNGLPFGTRIKLVGRVTFGGRRVFIVRDRIGWGSQLDFWHPSNARCVRWGRRNVRYVIVKRGRHR